MNWQDFLNTQTISDNISADTPRLYAVTHLSVLTISGSDAATFLQGQITCNVHDVTEQNSRFGAICTPKGRVISTFILAKVHDDFLMILPTELLPVVKERLQKYVLRAKVQFHIEQCVLGVSADEAEFLNTKQENDVVRVHLGQRDLLICNTDNAQTVWSDYINQGFQATTS
ncbi:partial tRNA-modifying protein YgfZ, partial [Patescibacteria group bacterium]